MKIEIWVINMHRYKAILTRNGYFKSSMELRNLQFSSNVNGRIH